MAIGAAARAIDLMHGRVLITRPLAAAQAWRTTLALRGIGSMIEPLLSYQPIKSSFPSIQLQAAIFTSIAGVHYLPYATLPAGWQDWPCYCVGQATARAARQQGWRCAAARGANAADLAAWVAEVTTPTHGALLWPCGAHHHPEPQAGLQGQGFVVLPWVVYDAVAQDRLSQNLQNVLHSAHLAAVLLTSERSARIFGNLLRQDGLLESCRVMSALCLSPAVAAATADLPWDSVICSPTPQEDALLTVLQNQLRRWTMCPTAKAAMLYEA